MVYISLFARLCQLGSNIYPRVDGLFRVGSPLQANIVPLFRVGQAHYMAASQRDAAACCEREVRAITFFYLLAVVI